MSNDYVEFSEVICNLTAEESEWLEHVLELKYDEEEDCVLTNTLPDGAVEVKNYLDDPYAAESWPPFTYEFRRDKGADGNYLWAHCDTGGVDEFVIVLCDFIAKFRPDAVMYVNFACTCDKPRIASFNGGTARVDKDGQFWCSGYEVDKYYKLLKEKEA